MGDSLSNIRDEDREKERLRVEDIRPATRPNASQIIRPKPERKDNINPDHYKAGGLEVIDILRAKLTPEQFEGFLMGNVIKYTFRCKMKNGAEDLKKAAWYSSMLAGVDPRK